MTREIQSFARAKQPKPLLLPFHLLAINLSRKKIATTTMKIVLALLGLAATANAVELTPDNWEAETTGKTVLIKFQA